MTMVQANRPVRQRIARKQAKQVQRTQQPFGTSGAAWLPTPRIACRNGSCAQRRQSYFIMGLHVNQTLAEAPPVAAPRPEGLVAGQESIDAGAIKLCGRPGAKTDQQKARSGGGDSPSRREGE